METPNAFLLTNSASSSSSSHSEERNRKPPPAYRSALHSVRKNVITKKPIAPMPPTPPKIYKVKPVHFRDVVQRLTAAPEFQKTRLREAAPPPLSLSQTPPVGFSMPSPSALAWCSSILLSPGTLSSLEASAVL